MRELNYDAKTIALEIATEGAIEAFLRKHSALICWNESGVSPVIDRADNGTCCFIKSEKLRFVASCAHVWQGFEKFASEHDARLWLSLVESDRVLAPAFPFLVAKPKLICEDVAADLATFTFEGINSLEPWRFYRFRETPRHKVQVGDRVFFLGYAGDGVRNGEASWTLNFSFFTNRVADTGWRRFLLHNKPGEHHSFDGAGKEIPPHRIPGVSGAPVFRVRNLGRIPLDLSLVGFVSQLCSSGLAKSQREVGGGASGNGYEMSDGDMFVTYSDILAVDGSLDSARHGAECA